jgi:membrane-bound lytic murein transglycosylase D
LAIVEIGTQIDIAQAANLANIDYELLRSLNPGYRQWATHPDSPQHLVVPIENSQSLINNLSKVSEQELLTWDRYEIRSGDTLGGIAKKLGTRVDILKTVNQLRSSQIIAGSSLLIPRSIINNVTADIPNYNRKNSALTPVPVPAKHTIRRGENLWSIARRYNIRSLDITRWNNIELSGLLQPGQVLNLQFTDSATTAVVEGLSPSRQNEYSVRRGDTMATIARRFDVSLEQLLNLNNMTVDAIIYPGQLLKAIP